MINSVMIDDDVLFLERFSNVIKGIAAEEKWDFRLDMVTEPSEILETDIEYDIYFFDIVMPKISGIELAKQLRKKHNNKEFVFVSANEQYIRDSMTVKPCGFVRKAYLKEDLGELFLQLRTFLEVKGGEVTLKNNRKDFVINPIQIMYVSSFGHYLRLVYADGTEKMIRNSMRAVEEKLQSHDFLRVSSHCMINLQHLQEADNGEVLLQNGYKEKITGTYLKNAAAVLGRWRDTHGIR